MFYQARFSSKQFFRFIVFLTTYCAFMTHNATAKAQEDIEVVDVIGKKPPEFFLHAYKERRTDFIEMYNSLVEDEDFKMYCNKSRSDSKANKLDICQPAFVQRIKKQEAMNGMMFGRRSIHEMAIGPVKTTRKLTRKRAAFDKNLAHLVNSNDDLKRKYLAFINALDVYEHALSEEGS
jgi:vacuolar-type H+-ATPase subunit I/STV1